MTLRRAMRAPSSSYLAGEAESLTTTPITLVLQLTLYFTILCAPILTGAVTGTGKYSNEDHTAISINPSAASILTYQLGRAACIVIAVALVFMDPPGLFDRLPDESSTSYGVWLTFLCYQSIEVLRSFVAKPGMSTLFNVAGIVVFLAIATARRMPSSSIFAVFRYYVAILGWITTVLIFVGPDIVLAQNHKGILPGISFRLNGFFSQANHFGFLLVAYLLMPVPPSVALQRQSLVRRLFSCATDLNVLLLLVLTQSKTSLFVFALGIAIYAAYRVLAALRMELRLLIFAVLVPIVLTVLFNYESIVNVLFSSTEYKIADALTFTGRTQVWELALEEWKLHPIFGYGTIKWQDAAINFTFTGDFKGFLPGHAHNQYVQTLWSDGLVGAIVLLAHLIFVVWLTFQLDPKVAPAFFALVMIMIVKGWSDLFMPVATVDPGAPTYIAMLLLLSAMSIETHEHFATDESPEEEYVTAVNQSNELQWQ